MLVESPEYWVCGSARRPRNTPAVGWRVRNHSPDRCRPTRWSASTGSDKQRGSARQSCPASRPASTHVLPVGGRLGGDERSASEGRDGEEEGLGSHYDEFVVERMWAIGIIDAVRWEDAELFVGGLLYDEVARERGENGRAPRCSCLRALEATQTRSGDGWAVLRPARCLKRSLPSRPFRLPPLPSGRNSQRDIRVTALAQTGLSDRPGVKLGQRHPETLWGKIMRRRPRIPQLGHIFQSLASRYTPRVPVAP